MAWNQVSLMEQKQQFVSLAASGRFTFTELCADFKVSRKTGHKCKCRPGCLVDGSQRREFFRRISRKYGNYDAVVARGFQSEGNSGRRSSEVVMAGKRPRRSRR
jgi:hypothetical protein